MRRTCLATPDEQVGWFFPAVKAGLRLLKRYQPDVIYSTGPPHSTHLVAVALKALTGTPVVIDLRDPWAGTTWDSEPYATVERTIQQWCERICVHRSDRVILNTGPLRDEFVSRYEDRYDHLFVVIPNGYDPSMRMETRVRSDGDRRESSAVRLCHPGSVYGARTLEPLIEALSQLKRAGHSFRLEQIGAIENSARITTKIADAGLVNDVSLLGQRSHGETLGRMADADILVLIQPRAPLQVPSKLFEMIPFQRPLLALTQQGATAEIVQRYGLGVVVPPDDPCQIASAMSRIAGGPAGRNLDRGWRAAMNEFDGRNLTGRLAGLFEDILTRKS